MPPGCVRPIDPHFNGLGFQFFGNSCHPDQRVYKQRGNAEKIGLPVRQDLMTEDTLNLLLQTAEGHIKQEEKTRRKKVNKTEQKPGPVGMMKVHSEILSK